MIGVRQKTFDQQRHRKSNANTMRLSHHATGAHRKCTGHIMELEKEHAGGGKYRA